MEDDPFSHTSPSPTTLCHRLKTTDNFLFETTIINTFHDYVLYFWSRHRNTFFWIVLIIWYANFYLTSTYFCLFFFYVGPFGKYYNTLINSK